MDAYQLFTQDALSPIANVCDTVYSVVCKIPNTLLGAQWPHSDKSTPNCDSKPAANHPLARSERPRVSGGWVKYIDRTKNATVANTANARKVAGWCRSLALTEEYRIPRALRRPPSLMAAQELKPRSHYEHLRVRHHARF